MDVLLDFQTLLFAGRSVKGDRRERASIAEWTLTLWRLEEVFQGTEISNQEPDLYVRKTEISVTQPGNTAVAW